MQSVLNHRLLVITGKGGVGKTTMAGAIGMLAAREGRRAIVVELGDQNRLGSLFGQPAVSAGTEVELERNLWSISIDPDKALLEWLQALGGRVSGRVLASSGTFQYFTAAAPGARELVSMVKISELAREGRRRRSASSGSYDLVILDAPASGHVLGLLRSPQTFGAIARVGPIVAHTRRVQELLEDSTRSAYLAVALASEMAVSEALELQDALHRELGRDLTAVIVNGLLPRRFTTAELTRVAALDSSGNDSSDETSADATSAAQATITRAAARAANAVHERSRMQRNQLARLRRREIETIGVPFIWDAQLDLAAVRQIAEQLARKL